MKDQLKTSIWQQFGAAIDSLESAIVACPETVWGNKPGYHEFWYLAYHTLFFLDLYLSDTSEEEFRPPEPFGLEELDPAGALPPRVYTRQELMAYLEHDRQKCRSVLRHFSDERAHLLCGWIRPGLTYFELHLYNMRHVQHHTAQLNLILRQKVNSAPRWVSKAKQPLFD